MIIDDSNLRNIKSKSCIMFSRQDKDAVVTFYKPKKGVAHSVLMLEITEQTPNQAVVFKTKSVFGIEPGQSIGVSFVNPLVIMFDGTDLRIVD